MSAQGPPPRGTPLQGPVFVTTEGAKRLLAAEKEKEKEKAALQKKLDKLDNECGEGREKLRREIARIAKYIRDLKEAKIDVNTIVLKSDSGAAAGSGSAPLRL